MSRGPGHVQRAIVACLEGQDRWWLISELARYAYGTQASSAAQLSAVRRAARQLVAQGRADSPGRGYITRRSMSVCVHGNT